VRTDSSYAYATLKSAIGTRFTVVLACALVATIRGVSPYLFHNPSLALRKGDVTT